jgi:hypothetical protein
MGPLFTDTRYEGMYINGYTFYTMTQDKKSIYQNSGVRVLTVKIRQPSHEFTFGVGMSFIPYPLVLTPVV